MSCFGGPGWKHKAGKRLGREEGHALGWEVLGKEQRRGRLLGKASEALNKAEH